MFLKRIGVFLPIFVAIGFWALFMVLPSVFPPRGPLDLSSFRFVNASSPSLEPGPSGSWDSYSVHAPSVLKINDEYVMWYDGTNGADPYAGWSIGMARASDGRSWTKESRNPVLTPGAPGEWDSVSVHDPRVLYDNKEYWMWYSGFDGNKWRIGLAISGDGMHWQKSEKNPIMDAGPPGSWDEAGVAYSTVLFLKDVFYMWYQGLDRNGIWRIGRASSRDGVAWIKGEANPVLSPEGNGWDGDKVLAPSVFFSGGSYHIWYTGGPKWAIGYAVSDDGITWRKKGSPVVFPSDTSTWDSQQILTSAAAIDGGKPVLWYAGRDKGGFSIGMSTGVRMQQ